MSHIAVLALFKEEPKDIVAACIDAMAPFEEGSGGPYEEWDYWRIEDDNGLPMWRGKVRDYPYKGYLYALIDEYGDWVDGPDLWPALELSANLFAVEIDAHR